MSYPETIRFLYSLQAHGMKFGLQGTRAILQTLGNPHRSLPCIHIAGTNGKGSTASMLAAIFTAAGYKTGLYTSPHLVDFSERIRVNGKPIGRKNIVRLTGTMRRTLVSRRSTFFEATTAMAFAWFAEQKADIAVIETGLGGRLDSTNVIRPLVSVITTVGFDHTEILGNTIAKIAYEKAGIIKKGAPCITGVKDPAALRVIRKVCRQLNADWYDASRYAARVQSSSPEGTVLTLKVGTTTIRDLHLGLGGAFQIGNAAMAIAAAALIASKGVYVVSEEHIRRGLKEVVGLSGIRGRLQRIAGKPPIYLDVAHNADAVRTLVNSIGKLFPDRVILVFGVMKDKECNAMVRSFAQIVKEAVAVAANTERSLRAGDVAMEFSRNGVPVTAALSVREGVRLALMRSGSHVPILISGSHFVVGEAYQELASKKVLDNQ